MGLESMAYTAIFLLVLQPWAAKSGFNLAPIVSPLYLIMCAKGKGNCKPSSNSTFRFNCECDPGWKQARSDHDDGLSFLPCVIPYSCRWAECGGGTCNKTSPFTYACQCEENYYNLLNVTALPCFRECALGAECSGLGISALNRSSSSQTPSSSDSDSNQAACSTKGGVFNLLAFMVILLAVVI